MLVGTGHLVRCYGNDHFYYTGLLQVQTTAQMVGYAITNMNAGPVKVYQTCMLVGTSLQI